MNAPPNQAFKRMQPGLHRRLFRILVKRALPSLRISVPLHGPNANRTGLRNVFCQ
jgi:hypothetical protein